MNSSYPSSPLSPYYKRPRRIELDDADILCPRPTCDGWLRLFANEGSTNPIYVCCSNDFDAEGHQRCCQKVMFSKFTNKCPRCLKDILTQEIITCSAVDGKWVHVTCFLKEKPVKLFSICLKCKASIGKESDAMPAVCGGKQGFRHIKCPPKTTPTIADLEETYLEDDDSVAPTTTSGATSTDSSPLQPPAKKAKK